MSSSITSARIAVVIPCYRSASTVAAVVRDIPSDVSLIVCVNDASDDELAAVLRSVAESDTRVHIATHDVNSGVGAATVSGYRMAIESDANVIVKVDSDGQMNPAFIPAFAAPIISGQADYVKGNRFFDIELVKQMPMLRLIGNAGLSFLTKLSTGYWTIFDPTNGYTAIHADVAALLPLGKLHKRYFFESDILFRLRLLDARVIELPIEARYGNETSHLSELNALMTFPLLHARNFAKRIIYNYFLRGFDTASLSLVAGAILFLFGLVFGVASWIESAQTGQPATVGTVMLSAVPVLIGFQMLLSFLQHDVAITPQNAIQMRLSFYKAVSEQDRKSRAADN